MGAAVQTHWTLWWYHNVYNLSKKESFRKDNKTYFHACIVESANSPANYSATSNYKFKIFLAYY